MFTNREVLKYTDLIENLNENQPISNNYSVIMQGKSIGGVPEFKLLNDSDNCFIIWVHGTDFKDPNYILINILIKPVEFYFSYCHQGYYYAGISILNLISEELLNSSINKIICIGHSLGGAVSSVIATILKKGENLDVQNANKLRDKFKDSVMGLVYASPPVFSPSLSVQTREYITNIVLSQDIVPKLGKTFDCLKKYQNLLVTHLLKRCKAVKTSDNYMDDLEKFISSCNQMDIVADRIPGKVIVINQSNLTMKNSNNLRDMNDISEFKNVMKHELSNYLTNEETISSNGFLKDLDEFYTDEDQNWYIKATNQRVHMKKESNDPQKIEALKEEYNQLLKFSNQLLPIPVGFYHPDDSNDYCLITVYAENGSLDELMTNTHFLDSDSQKFVIISGIALSMKCLHSQNVIHGRLSPSHILINKESEPILFNYGISRHIKDIGNSDSYKYLAPELIDGGEFTEKGDVYSFGLIVNQLYSDSNIFANYSLDEISRMKKNDEFEPSENIPETINEIIMQCMDIDPNSRPSFNEIFNALVVGSHQMEDADVSSSYINKIINYSKRKAIFRIPQQILKLPQDDYKWDDKTSNPIDFDKLEKIINPENGKKAIIIMTIGEFEAGKSTFLREITGNLAYRSGKGLVTQTLGLHFDGPYTKKDIIDNVFMIKYKKKFNSINLSDDTEIYFIDSQGIGDVTYSKYESVLDRIYPIFSAVSTICISVCSAKEEKSVRDVFKIIRRLRLMEVNFITHAVLLIRDYEPFTSMKDFDFKNISDFCQTFTQLYTSAHNENVKYYISEYLSILPLGDFTTYGKYLFSIWYDFYQILSLVDEKIILTKQEYMMFLHTLSDILFKRDFFLIKKFVLENKKFKKVPFLKQFKRYIKKKMQQKEQAKQEEQKQQQEQQQEIIQEEIQIETNIDKVKENIEKISENQEEEEEIFEDIDFSKKQTAQMNEIDYYYVNYIGKSSETMKRCIKFSYYIVSNIVSVLAESRFTKSDINELYYLLIINIKNFIRFILPFMIGDMNLSINDYFQYANQMQKDINSYMAKNDKKWLEHMKNESNAIYGYMALTPICAGSAITLAIPIAGEIIANMAIAASAAMKLYSSIQSLIRKFIIEDKFDTSLFPFIWDVKMKKSSGKDFNIKSSKSIGKNNEQLIIFFEQNEEINDSTLIFRSLTGFDVKFTDNQKVSQLFSDVSIESLMDRYHKNKKKNTSNLQDPEIKKVNILYLKGFSQDEIRELGEKQSRPPIFVSSVVDGQKVTIYPDSKYIFNLFVISESSYEYVTVNKDDYIRNLIKAKGIVHGIVPNYPKVNLLPIYSKDYNFEGPTANSLIKYGCRFVLQDKKFDNIEQ